MLSAPSRPSCVRGCAPHCSLWLNLCLEDERYKNSPKDCSKVIFPDAVHFIIIPSPLSPLTPSPTCPAAARRILQKHRATFRGPSAPGAISRCSDGRKQGRNCHSPPRKPQKQEPSAARAGCPSDVYVCTRTHNYAQRSHGRPEAG